MRTIFDEFLNISISSDIALHTSKISVGIGILNEFQSEVLRDETLSINQLSITHHVLTLYLPFIWIVEESDDMATNSQNHNDPEGSVNGQESTTKDKKKPKGWKDLPKKSSNSLSAALRRIFKTKNELLKQNYTGKKIQHFQIIVI